ncbi:GNAT family N-acetyltransferase [Enterococcus pseudoavium]|uniref:GNAT family N-acetyltransferase n=1 Tax=Enterococcus pseudoavium TaxID=44007 RepID=A0AAE4I1V1_9ENTE|nr:GNAT family N-acetyltransferase [Enterococcus pseudoavium]MDT2737038.1 GNAT family N-acetyltransferase [Enterococcus pseudoavium]MDT2753832.1 GNAT family N-acetyltransferase [Enterococcus pseudoavium]MDT2771053.1 GNAT family N-acetyltransferase [Enterococcus pseudoavium]REC31415.1 N-acetyltransferase [Enterococcus pseudoavium]
MLTQYRTNQRKIAMGLLSFHDNLKDQRHLLKEIDTYEADDRYQLFCYYDKDSENVQGVIGISELDDQEIVLHDISLNPSYRGEGVSIMMMNELQEVYPERKIIGTPATSPFLAKWQERK